MASGREKEIFLEALDLAPGAERDAYLAGACEGDPALRRAVDDLLAAHGRASDLLDDGPDPGSRLERQLEEAAEVLGLDRGSPDAEGPPFSDRVGQRIGPYRLMEKLGEGGFGEVYVAEQQEPVRRRVALKLLKLGLGSRDMIARFEAERQALAMMDHPHIAQVFDAGATPLGQPYFAMELVRGVPITEFCEERRLTIPARLELFIDVCHAVQHAHQKGVIHRDLKPSNVLTTLHDVKAVVKVIDFGVAKAFGEPLTDKTLYTGFAQMIGTPMYMSPEQAEMNALDVDTRSDIYSLGVLLYELLTGATPFDRERLHTATFDELRRIIRAEDPPRPSARLSTLDPDRTTTIATHRRMDPRALVSMLRGDLDWVVTKALEKDRQRRYETAGDLARDVERHLDLQPVTARAPSSWYRVQKLALRNRVAFTTASLVLLALLAGTAVSTWQAVRATRARSEAEELRQEATEFADRLKAANVLLDGARANADEGRWSLAWKQYTSAAELQPDHYVTWSGRASLAVRLGAWRTAAADFTRALRLGAAMDNPGWWGVPQLCLWAGEVEGYELACATLGEELRRRDPDPMLVVFAVRALSMRERPTAEAGALAGRVDELLANRWAALRMPAPLSWTFPLPSFPPGSPGRPGSGPEDHGPEDRDPRPGPEDRRSRSDPDERGPGSGPEDRPFLRGGWPAQVPTELFWYTSALAKLRAGDVEPAIQLLRLVVSSEARFPAAPIALPPLALAYLEEGRNAEATATLDASEESLDAWLSALAEGSPKALRIPWFDVLECAVLQREAEERIRGARRPEDPRLARIEERALALLRGD